MYGPLCLLRGVAYVYTSLVKVRGWQDRICLAESCLEFARNGFSFLGTISKIACLAGCCHPHVIFLSQKIGKWDPPNANFGMTRHFASAFMSSRFIMDMKSIQRSSMSMTTYGVDT